jgi:ATP phosphoribosyltransferase regulatory subunit
MFKFQDFDGKILALRAEMTAPVARIVSTKISSMPTPIRLFYVSNVFRYSQSYVEREREFWQAGVELIGSNTSEADGEILALLVSSLRKLGLEEVRLDVGHASLLKDLLNATGLDEEKKSALRSLLTNRDQTRLEAFMDKNNLPSKLRDTFFQLSRCRRLDELASISFDSPQSRKTCDHLRKLLEVRDALTDYNIENLVFFDFSLTRKIEYYTGLVFEASVPNLGLPLGGGGRYDHFIEKFEKLKLPATGFALEIEECLKALTVQGFQISEKTKRMVLVASKSRNVAIKAVNLLREAGVSALLSVTKNDKSKTIKYAKLAGMGYTVFVGSSLEKPVTVCDMRSGVSRKETIKTFLQQIEANQQ